MIQVPFFSMKEQTSSLKEEFIKEVNAVLDESIFILGKKLIEFEKNFSEYIKTSYCLGVNSGTDALVLAIQSLQLPKDAEIIIPANTFISTALAIYHANLKIKLIDIDPKTYLMDLNQLEASIGPKTKAIIPVHLYGQMVDMKKLMFIAKKHNLFVIEDTAQAHGANIEGELAGSFGDIGCFSFYPSKNLGCLGDGGAITTSNLSLYENIFQIRNIGQKEKYNHTSIGYNSRLDEIQAAFLNVKLKYLDHWNNQRKKVASFYNEALQNVGDIICPYFTEKSQHVFHLYVVRTKFRSELANFLTQNKIGHGIHYPTPIHKHNCFLNLNLAENINLKYTEECAEEIISLPIYPEITQNELIYVVEQIKTFFAKR